MNVSKPSIKPEMNELENVFLSFNMLYKGRNHYNYPHINFKVNYNFIKYYVLGNVVYREESI